MWEIVLLLTCLWIFFYCNILNKRHWRFSSLLGSNENIPMWVGHIFHLISLVCPTRIMGRPVTPCVAFEIIVSATKISTGVEHRSITLTWWKFGRRQRIVARVCHPFNNLTADAPFLPINQTSSSRMAD